MSAVGDIKPGGGTATGPATFSYAAAAKGLVSNSNSAPAGSPSLGSGLAASQNTAAPAQDQKNGEAGEEQNSTPSLASLEISSPGSPNNDLTSPSSPEFGASSTSTLLREDDSSSTPQAPSEATTWENKSQASNQEKVGEDKARGHDSAETEIEQAKPVKKLHDAPPPAINPWTKRAEEQKTRSAAQAPLSKLIPQKAQLDAHRHSAPDARSAPLRSGPERNRRDGPEGAPRRTRRASIPTPSENKPSGSMTAPLPSMGDSESWPTPLTAQDEDRRRGSANGNRDRTQPNAGTGKKHDWVSVPINPTVIFNTPISTGTRRGGRGGGRGGRDSGRGGLVNGISRTTTNHMDNAVPKSASPMTTAIIEAAATESAPPQVSNAEAISDQDTVPKQNGNAESSVVKSVPPPTAEEFVPRNPQVVDDLTKDVQGSYSARPSNKVKPFRRQEETDGDTARSHIRRASASAQQSSEYQHVKGDTGMEAASLRQSGSDRRQSQYGGYPPRERPERGRGGRRGGLTNGFHAQSQQSVPNGYVPTHAFGQPRNFRGSSRAHSIPTETIYGGRPINGYATPYLTLQTPVAGYEYGMYQMMQPMSAIPYDNGVGQHQVVNMVQTQLEYYFSVENLIRDTYLRKHMDGQGYIYLSVIASFNRLKSLSHDYELIKFACAQTPSVEYRIALDGRERVRKREDWQKWVMPLADRDPAAQHDGIIEYRQAPQMAAVPTNFPIRQASLPNHGVSMSAPGGHFTPANFPFTPINGNASTQTVDEVSNSTDLSIATESQVVAALH